MTTKLFIDVSNLKFEKQASVDLRDPATWSEDILTTLFADKPYAGNYQAKVVYKKKDPEAGYAFGYVELSAEQNTNVVKIPFVVDSSKLKSMDVISTNSKILPLTRPRLEEAIFTPKVLGDRIDDKDVYNQTEQAAYSNVYPPSRQVGIGQVSTKISALLPKIKNTMAPADLQKFASQLMGDKDLHKLAMNKDSVLSALRIFAEAEKMEKRASAAPKVNPPDPAVIQMSVIKDPENKTCSYRVKTASYLAYRPDIEVLDRASAINKYGSTSVRVADARGHLTATYGGSSEDGVPGLDPICRSGIYRIVGMDGTLGMGVVVDKVFGMDGTNPTKLLFTDGDKYSMQDDMVGKRVGNIDCRQWENKTPKGMGIFVWGDTDDEFKCSSSCGAPECTMPVSVELVEDSNGQEEINVNDLTGKSYKVVKAPVKTLIYTKEVTLIPDKAFFIPTNTLFPISDGKSAEKIAEARDLDKSVLIKFTSDQFSFSGNPVEGLEAKEKTAMSWADAQFLGCSLGMTPEFSESKLAQAMKYGKTTVKVAQSLTPFRVFEARVMAKVASYTKAVNDHISSLKSYLLKEAVAIGDEESVDAILSLGFMNPDNIEKFVEDLPVLEKAQQKLCELLLATRLGLKEIDEGALESAIKSLEKSIEGLKRLAHTIVAGGSIMSTQYFRLGFVDELEKIKVAMEKDAIGENWAQLARHGEEEEAMARELGHKGRKAMDIKMGNTPGGAMEGFIKVPEGVKNLASKEGRPAPLPKRTNVPGTHPTKWKNVTPSDFPEVRESMPYTQAEKIHGAPAQVIESVKNIGGEAAKPAEGAVEAIKNVAKKPGILRRVLGHPAGKIGAGAAAVGGAYMLGKHLANRSSASAPN